MLFERATLADVDVLIGVQNKSFYLDYLKYGECPGYNRSYESMSNTVNSYMTYKIMYNGQMIGVIVVRDNGNEDYFLGCLCVIPEYENKGIGQSAMRFLKQQFPKAVHWSLETPADKERNHYFYKKFGYQITRRYLHGVVEIVLLERWCEKAR